MITGAVVDLDTPLGTKLTITYGADGRMTGQAGALAFYLGASRDKGKWWVASDMLCQKWERWFDAETQCMRIKKEGPRIHWASRDGKTGTGTVHLKVAAAADAARPTQKPVVAKAAVTAAPAPPAKQPRVIMSALPSPVKPVEKVVEKPAGKAADVSVDAAPEVVAPEPVPAVHPRPLFSRLNVPYFAPVDMAKAPETNALAELPTLEPSTAPAHVAAGLVVAAPAPTSAPAVEVTRKADVKPAPPTVPKHAAAAPAEPMFKVVNVRSSDVLNVREGPSWDREVVGAIPPGGRGVAVTGECRSQWCPVRHHALRGWVNRTYLESEDGEIVVYGGAAPAGAAGDSPDAPRACLSSAAKELLGRIEAKFGPMQLVSTCRSGATVAGSARPSLHRNGNAIDFKAGARKQEVVDWLVANHTQGGTMTYRDMDHIHIDIGPHFVALGGGGRSGRDWSSGKMGLSSAK